LVFNIGHSLLLKSILRNRVKKEKNFGRWDFKQLEERMTKLTDHRNCVSTSTAQEQLKACHEKMRNWLQDQREDRMEMRKERMEKRKLK